MLVTCQLAVPVQYALPAQFSTMVAGFVPRFTPFTACVKSDGNEN